MSLFEIHSVEDHAKGIAHYMPGGKIWRAKNIVDSKLRALLRGFGASAKRQEEILDKFWDEVFIGTSEEFLPDFEKAVGIPDDCFPGTGTIAERQADVQLKMVSLYVVTEQDFIDLAAILGFTITIERTVGVRFTWTILGDGVATVGFPYEFPFTFGETTNSNILQCLFKKLKPANTRLLFQNT